MFRLSPYSGGLLNGFLGRKMQQKTIILLLLAMLMSATCVFAQTQDEEHHIEVGIAFRQGKNNIDLSYMDNRAKLEHIVHVLDSIRNDNSVVLREVQFSGAASPEGSAAINRWLSRTRLEQLEKYIRERVDIPDSLIVRDDLYIPWEELAEKVQASDASYKDEVLQILATEYPEAKDWNGAIVDGRIVELKKLEGGKVWQDLYARYFSQLRNAYTTGATYIVRHEPSIRIVAVIPARKPMPVAKPQMPVEAESQRPPLHLYLKTNAIGWGMSVSNVAVEVDFAKRWSVQLPIYYSGVNYFTQTIKFRTFAVQPEVRYWFSGNMNDKFFLGAHAGVAYYNYAVDGQYRIQDKDGKRPALGGGLSVGYRMPISKNGRLKMEFSIGGGVYSLKYDKFYNTQSTSQGELSHSVDKIWYGVDHAAVSFSYMFNLKRKNK